MKRLEFEQGMDHVAGSSGSLKEVLGWFIFLVFIVILRYLFKEVA